jgi:hypothetical protein
VGFGYKKARSPGFKVLDNSGNVTEIECGCSEFLGRHADAKVPSGKASCVCALYLAVRCGRRSGCGVRRSLVSRDKGSLSSVLAP